MSTAVSLKEESFTYEEAPLLVYWEATHACELACLHCRAEADSIRDPLELSTDEAKRLCEQISHFGGSRPPRLVVTGGDPLLRPDLGEIVTFARTIGLDVSVTPAATSRLDADAIRRLKEMGTGSIALSLDGSTPERHDRVRGVEGTFARTTAALLEAERVGLPVQVNTLVAGATVGDLPDIYELLSGFGIERWALFFLIATGRGSELEDISPDEAEAALTWLCTVSESPERHFAVKATEAHQVRRIAYQRHHARGGEDDTFRRSPLGRGLGVRDGNGIVFVSRRGEIFPSGFLPITTGNVRSDGLVETYRGHELFRSLRDADRLRGKCGRCPYRSMCGGSRARAYAATGDPLESDPLCLYPTIRFRESERTAGLFV